MTIKYTNWSLDKLKKERIKIDKAIKTVEKRDKKATLEKIAVIAKQSGFELDELFSVDAIAAAKSRNKTASKRKASKPRGKVPPKYRNPSDETHTWTGRGRQPIWVKEHVANGGSLDGLKIH